MAGNLETSIKIQALVKGLEDVAAMTAELQALAAEGGQSIPDPTEDLRSGAGETSGALRETAGAAEQVGDSAEQAAADTAALQAALVKVAAAGAGVLALAGALKTVALESMEADTRQRKLEGVVRATGGAAGFTAEQIHDMASELALATLGSIRGFEDAAAALLTFKSVTGQAFERALELSQDLASVMGGDTKSAALQLGKALEDPAHGLSALTRSGVSFTEQEQELIKSLAEAGETAKAHGLILDKVAEQVGGVAREMAGGLAGALDTLGQRFEELKVKSGDALQPALINITNQLSGALEFLAENLDTVATLAETVGTVAVVALAGKAATAARAYAGALTTATVATAALAAVTHGLAAAGRAAFASGTLLASAWPVAVFAGVAYAVAKLSGGLDELQEDSERLAQAQESLAETSGRLADRYREISTATGISVKNAKDFNAAVAAGRIAWDDAAGSWKAGAGAIKLVATEAEAARFKLEKVQAEFMKMRAEGEGTAAALKKVISAADISDVGGIAKLLADLELLRKSALATGEQIQTALGDRLAQLSANELREFGIMAQMALGQGEESAQALAEINDLVLAASFEKLGITAETALGKISPAAQEAIDTLDLVVKSLEKSKVSAEQSAIAIELALTKAFAAADSQPALDQLNQRMKELADQGKLGADAMSRLGAAAAEARARVDEMAPGIQSVEEAFRELGVTSKTALAEAARAAKEAYDVIANSGKAGPREIAEAWLEYAKRAIAANEGVASASLKAEAAALGQEAALKKLLAAAPPLSENMKAIAEAMNETVAAAEKSTQVTERKAAADVRAAETTLELAKAKGDEVEITKAQIALAETQLQGSRRIASAKEAEASAADKKVAALKKEAQADGEVSDAEKEAIATAEEAAAAKRDTAEASREKAEADEAELQKVRELAEGQKDAIRAVAEAVDGTAVDLEKGLSVPWLTGAAAASQYAAEAIEAAKRAAAALATDVNPYEFMERYARGYIRTLEDIDRRQSALNSTAGDGVEDLRLQLLRLEGTKEQIDAAEKARDLAKVERNIQLMQLEIQRARVRGDDAEVTRLEAEIRLLQEQLVLIEKIHKAEARQREGKSTKSGGGAGMSGGGGAEVPAPGVRPQVNIVVNNTIEGLLDVQDRGSLDQLGRRLAPIWADLQRRGAF
jgi:hypothetical protein